jgi:hypothetical protein
MLQVHRGRGWPAVNDLCGAPSVLVMPARSKAWATRRPTSLIRDAKSPTSRKVREKWGTLWVMVLCSGLAHPTRFVRPTWAGALTIFACTIPAEGAPSLRFLQGWVAMLPTPFLSLPTPFAQSSVVPAP